MEGMGGYGRKEFEKGRTLTLLHSTNGWVLWLRPGRRLHGGRVATRRSRHGCRHAVGPTVVIAAVVTGRLDTVAGRLRVDEVAALRVGRAG